MDDTNVLKKTPRITDANVTENRISRASVSTNQKGKILILVENLSFPFDQRVWREATTLKKAGYKVIVISPMGEVIDNTSYEVINDIDVYRFKNTFEVKSGMFGYLGEYSLALIKMFFLSLSVFFKQGFDVIQICNPPDVLFLVTLPFKLLGKKVVFDQHDLSPEIYLSKKGLNKSNFVHKALLILERLTYRFSDVVISTNQSYKKLAITRGGVNPERIFIVRNAPDPEIHKKISSNGLTFPNNSTNQNILCYLGIMGLQDGVDYLLRALHHLIHTHKRKDFHTILVGSGPELSSLKNYTRSLGIDDFVTFTGRLPYEEALKKVSNADICLCPDPKTPLNNVSTMSKVIDYMSMGKPIVSFDLKETKFSAGEGSLYSRANDERDFANNIKQLLDSYELRKELGKIGRARFQNILSWEHSMKNLYQAYKLAFKDISK